MPPKRAFRQPKSEEEEKAHLENAVPPSTRYNTKWACKIFREWQYGRPNKDATLEATGFRVDVEQVQSLETSMETMTCWSLNFWLTKFVEEVCKASGERYPPRTLYSICAGLQRHLEDVNGGDAIQLLSKNEMRYRVGFCCIVLS